MEGVSVVEGSSGSECERWDEEVRAKDGKQEAIGKAVKRRRKIQVKSEESERPQ